MRQIVITGAPNPERDFIALHLRAKGVVAVIKSQPGPLTYTDDVIVLEGYATIFNYVEERFPAPPLMPVDIIGRARMRQMVYETVTKYYPGNGIPAVDAEVYERHYLHRGAFLTGAALSIVDIALFPIVPVHSRAWLGYHNRVARAIHGAAEHPTY